MRVMPTHAGNVACAGVQEIIVFSLLLLRMLLPFGVDLCARIQVRLPNISRVKLRYRISRVLVHLASSFTQVV
jgi:hypothetical protein